MNDIKGAIHSIIRTTYKNIPLNKVPFEDMVQAGYIGYLTAKDRYSKERSHNGEMSYKFMRYFVWNEINKLVSASMSDKHTAYFDVVPDVFLTDDDCIDLVQQQRLGVFLKGKVKSLPEKQRIVITKMYLQDPQLTMTEIAMEMGVTRSRVQQIKELALYKLKNLINVKDVM